MAPADGPAKASTFQVVALAVFALATVVSAHAAFGLSLPLPEALRWKTVVPADLAALALLVAAMRGPLDRARIRRWLVHDRLTGPLSALYVGRRMNPSSHRSPECPEKGLSVAFAPLG